ncbi:MAG: undecaprenyl-diphosphate phosphatase [Eubacteriales bacterium]|nr:undecaprenyl-diphosphate phosphatase [Eubacteriales bacterium]MDD4513274.1 undecaprenyl-diphosphate phosphatase [Eubacteriales bacterium]
MVTIFQAIVLGIVQGLAEFLPISSSGHLTLARAIMGMQNVDTLMLDVLLHVGTLIAVLVVFWRDWIDMLAHPIKNKTLLMLIIATLPTVIVVLLFNDTIASFFSGWFLGPAFLITALFMVLAEVLSRRAPKTRRAGGEVGYKSAISMGIMQVVAILPGVSRSGSTLLGGLATGLKRKTAAQFCFMMSAPAILGSVVFKGKDAYESGLFATMDIVPVICGMLAAAVVGYLAIRFMLALIQKISLYWFALYVAIVGIAVLAVQLTTTGIFPPFAFPTMQAAQGMLMTLR